MSRLQAWALESRTRYALVWGGMNAATVCSVYVLARFPEISVGRVVRYVVLGIVIAATAHALIWYPIAKRKLTTRRG